MLFVSLFNSRLIGFVCFLFSWCLGRAAVCDCGTPWTFLLPFFMHIRCSKSETLNRLFESAYMNFSEPFCICSKIVFVWLFFIVFLRGICK